MFLRALGILLGRVMYYALPDHRALALDHLAAALGNDLTMEHRRRIARRCFSHWGQFAIELIYYPRVKRARLASMVQVEGMDRLEQALSAGHGAIILASHFGNFEYIALYLTLFGPGGPVVARPLRNPWVDRWWVQTRLHHGVPTVDRTNSPRPMLQALRENRLIGVLPDQDVAGLPGVFVRFFGRLTWTPTGPVALARASGAALVPVFMRRKRSGFVLHILSAIPLADTGNRPRDILTNTQRWSTILEDYIRRYPDQWVWFHRRWKTQPAAGKEGGDAPPGS